MLDESLTETEPAIAVKNGKRHRTREALLNAALALIAEKGVQNTAVLDITQSLQISNGTFYYHFQNIEDLLAELGQRVAEQLLEQIRAVTRTDPAAQIARGPLIILKSVAENPDLREILLRVILDQENSHEELGDKLRDDIERGRSLGRFAVENVDFANRICRSITLAALTAEEIPGLERERLATLAAVHSLAVLGVPLWEAHDVVAREQFELTGESGSGA